MPPLDAATWNRVREAFLDALDLAPAERAPYLAGLDGALRPEVERLLAAHATAEAEGALASAFEAPTDDGPLPPPAGPWRPVGRLGAGGMGVVFEAEREGDGFRQRAALKLVRPGFGPDFAGRFVRERAVLAGLEHAGVARLLDGGLTADGLPYLAMELVEGAPVTDHADARGLGVEARVRLFLQVCDAVAYAHRRLVVHRDLKPSNVLVTDDGRAKLLDFGVAKLLDGDDDGLTRTRGPMSRAYAAPEQHAGGDVTTATDVYALGALLYELLTGRRPLDLGGLTAAAAERAVATRDPSRPSEAAPPARALALRGDLDAVVLKALAKEPERRYPSADALAADLRRHLGGLPVEARAPTVGYRVGRFVRRHRAGVAAAAVAVLALVAGLGAALWQAGEARAEAAKARAVEAFLGDVLAAPAPLEEGRDVRVADVLDRAAASLDTAFADQPDVRADAHRRLGQTYYALGLLEAAEGQYERALALTEGLDGPRAASTALARRDLGVARRDLADYDGADSLFALALEAAGAAFGPDAPETAGVLAEVGTLRYVTGDAAGAEAAYRRVLAIEEATLPPDDPELLISLGNLAVALVEGGDAEGAARLFERQARLYRDHHPRDAENHGNALANLGSVYAQLDRYDDAARVQTEAVARFRAGLGPDHPDTGFGLSNLGATLHALGRNDEAEAALREAAAIYRAALGPDHPNVGYPLVNLSKTLRALGRLDEAAAAAAEAEALFRTGLGDDHPAVERAVEARRAVEAARG